MKAGGFLKRDKASALSAGSSSLRVVWTAEEYGTGIPTIDREHQCLFDYINALSLAKDRSSVAHALDALVDYTDIHFAHEEVMFERTGYPLARAHVSAHTAFRKRVAVAVSAFKASGELDAGVIDFLVEWLGNHIKKMDRGYVHFLAPMMQNHMYGVMYSSLRDLAVQRFSEKTWRRVCADTGAPLTAQHQSFVPDEQYLRALDALARAVSVDRLELLQAAGFQWVLSVTAVPGHRGLMQTVGPTFREALANLGQLHQNAKASEYLEMLLPEFNLLSSAPGVARLRFVPSRVSRYEWVQPFMSGALRGLASSCYGIDAVVTISSFDASSMEVIFDIRWTPEPTEATRSAGPSSDEDEDSSLAEDDAASPNQLCPHGIDGPALALAFPFHFVLESSGRLAQAGPSLRKLLPDLEVGSKISTVIAVTYPVSAAGKIKVRALRRCTGDIAMLTANARRTNSDIPVPITLKGRFVSSGKRVVFLGTPLFASLQDLSSFGLTLNDFAVADPALTLLFQQRSVITESSAEDDLESPPSSSRSPSAPSLPALDGNGNGNGSGRGGLLERLFGSASAPKPTATDAARRGSVRRSAADFVVAAAAAAAGKPRSSASSSAIAAASAGAGMCPVDHPRLVLNSTYPGRVADVLRDQLLGDADRGFPFISRLVAEEFSGSGRDTDASLFDAVAVFYAQHGLTRQLARKFFLRGLSDSPDDGADAAAAPALRNDTPCSRIITCLLVAEGGSWLLHLLHDAYSAIREGKLAGEGSETRATAKLVEIFEAIAADGAPPGVAVILQQAHVLLMKHQPQHVGLLLANVLVLRFIAAAVVDPRRLPGSTDRWSGDQVRGAVQLSKRLQTLTSSEAAPEPSGPNESLRAAYDRAINAVLAQPASAVDIAPLGCERLAAILERIRDSMVVHLPALMGDSSVATGPVFQHLLSTSLRSLLFVTQGMDS